MNTFFKMIRAPHDGEKIRKKTRGKPKKVKDQTGAVELAEQLAERSEDNEPRNWSRQS